MNIYHKYYVLLGSAKIRKSTFYSYLVQLQETYRVTELQLHY